MASSIDMVIGILSIVCGIYCLYGYMNMKKTGKINASILLGNSVDPKKCKNKEEYLKAVLPKVLILGIALILYGGAAIWNLKVLKNSMVVSVSLCLFTLVLIWFAYTVSQARKKYF